MSDHTPTIDEILARVRAETAAVAVEEAPPTGRRQGLGTIPSCRNRMNGEKIPLGRPFYTIEEFAALDDEDFLRNAYRVVLAVTSMGRPRLLFASPSPGSHHGRASTERTFALCGGQGARREDPLAAARSGAGPSGRAAVHRQDI